MKGEQHAAAACILPMKETILIFEAEDAILKTQLDEAFAPLAANVRYISRDQYHLPVGRIAVSAAPSAAGARPAADGGEKRHGAPMLVFAGFTSDSLDRALDALKKRRISIPYKAVLTAANAAWRPAELFEELKKEHDSMA